MFDNVSNKISLVEIERIRRSPEYAALVARVNLLPSASAKEERNSR